MKSQLVCLWGKDYYDLQVQRKEKKKSSVFHEIQQLAAVVKPKPRAYSSYIVGPSRVGEKRFFYD